MLLESLGCALRGLGRTGEALAAFDRAFALGHDPTGILVLKAGALMETGRLDEAQQALETALARAPDLPAAWTALAELRPFAPADPALARMEHLLATSPNLRELDARTAMHFALGKAYRKSGDREQAFRHFAAGNALKRSSIDYDVAADENLPARRSPASRRR